MPDLNSPTPVQFTSQEVALEVENLAKLRADWKRHKLREHLITVPRVQDGNFLQGQTGMHAGILHTHLDQLRLIGLSRTFSSAGCNYVDMGARETFSPSLLTSHRLILVILLYNIISTSNGRSHTHKV